MIIESLDYENTRKEVFEDYEKELKKKAKEIRTELRKPYLGNKANPILPGRLSKSIIVRTKNYNTWYLKTTIWGDSRKPKVCTHLHCKILNPVTGSLSYLIFRGFQKGGKDKKGYLTWVKPDVVNALKRKMKTLGTDEILEQIYFETEVSVFREFKWTDNYLDEGQIVMKSASGYFLGYIRKSGKLTLLKFVDESKIYGEEMEKFTTTLLVPAYIASNNPGILEHLDNLSDPILASQIQDFMKNRFAFTLGI